MLARDPSAKAIVFSQFTSMLDLIAFRLQQVRRCCVSCVNTWGPVASSYLWLDPHLLPYCKSHLDFGQTFVKPHRVAALQDVLVQHPPQVSAANLHFLLWGLLVHPRHIY